MDTLEQELAKKQLAHAAEINAIMAKHMVLAGVRDRLGTQLDGYISPSVHPFELYKSKGSIVFRRDRYEYTRKGKNPDRALLGALLRAFEPLELIKVKSGGCTSFRPESGYQERERDDVYECGPVKVDIDGLSADEVKFQWYAKVLVDGVWQVWRIVVEYPMYGCDLGKVNQKAIQWNHQGDAVAWEWQYHPSNGARETGVQHVRFVSGDRGKTPNHFSLYWDRDSGWGLVRGGGMAEFVKE